MSPVEERHIDYILEEEFSIDPDFLTFFLDQARLSAIDKNRIVSVAAKCSCWLHALRPLKTVSRICSLSTANARECHPLQF